jgi:hypothetical protein
MLQDVADPFFLARNSGLELFDDLLEHLEIGAVALSLVIVVLNHLQLLVELSLLDQGAFEGIVRPHVLAAAQEGEIDELSTETECTRRCIQWPAYFDRKECSWRALTPHYICVSPPTSSGPFNMRVLSSSSKHQTLCLLPTSFKRRILSRRRCVSAFLRVDC